MRLLLDTHVILWWYFDASRLSREHVQLISDFA
jgi:PIN domain nuclease of toxin-antitoxin system